MNIFNREDRCQWKIDIDGRKNTKFDLARFTRLDCSLSVVNYARIGLQLNVADLISLGCVLSAQSSSFFFCRIDRSCGKNGEFYELVYHNYDAGSIFLWKYGERFMLLKPYDDVRMSLNPSLDIDLRKTNIIFHASV